MSLNDAAGSAAVKKVKLMENDFWRYAVRSILAGVYLTLGTAFAVVAGHAVEQVAPGVGLGAIVFALFFGLGLYSIIILGAELATGNMMYMIYGAVQKVVTWNKAFQVIVVSTLLNLVGCVLIGFLMSQATSFMDIGPEHLAATLSEGKLNKDIIQLLIEGSLANFVVNMAVLGAVFAKDHAGKFLTVVFIIAVFVGLGLEHIIANFSLMSLVMFSADPMIESMTAGNVAINWIFVWIGNVIGGGFLMGGVYAWLNRGDDVYRD